MNPNSFKCESDPNLTKRQNALRTKYLNGFTNGGGDVVAVAVRFVNNDGTPRSDAYTFGLPGHLSVPASGDYVFVPTPSGMSIAVVGDVRFVPKKNVWFKEWVIGVVHSSVVRKSCAIEKSVDEQLKAEAKAKRRVVQLRKDVMAQRDAVSKLAKESDKAVAELGAYVMASAVLDVIELNEVRARATSAKARVDLALDKLKSLGAQLASAEASL